MAKKVSAAGLVTQRVILDTTEALMVNEGYAAVTTRRVAGIAELAPALVHYYFPTTDDLLLAVYRRSTEQYQERLNRAIASDRPLTALWDLSTDRSRTVLAAEFMAMANHRKAISAEIARNIERTRSIQADLLGRLLKDQPGSTGYCDPAALSFILAGVTRAFVMERALGISAGHEEAVQFIQRWMAQFESPSAVTVETPAKQTKRAVRSSARSGSRAGAAASPGTDCTVFRPTARNNGK